MLTGTETQDTLRPSIVIRINADKLIPDSVFRRLDEVPEHIKQALAEKPRRTLSGPEVIITDTTSVCTRNSIADLTFFDSLGIARNMADYQPLFFPYHNAGKALPVRQEYSTSVIYNLYDGKSLPVKALHHDWIIIVLFLAAYLWLIAKTASRKMFSEMSGYLLLRGINDPSAHDTGSVFTLPSTIMNFISFMVIALFGYSAASFYDFIPSGISPFLFMLITLAAVIVSVTSRHFICLAAGSLSGQQEVFNEYLVSIYKGYRFSSVMIFAVVILLVYTVIIPQGILITTGAIILIIFYIVRVLRLFLIFIKRNISVLYLILYLCALEILPVMILIKYITGFDI